MDCAVIPNSIFSVSQRISICYNRSYGSLPLIPCHFLPQNSLFKSKNRPFLPVIQMGKVGSRRSHPRHVVFASQSSIFKALQKVIQVGTDGVEAGTNLVPDSIPRPVARISVTVVGAFIGIFLLKSLLSTALFVVGMMGLIYLAFIALNKDEGPKGGGGGGGGGSGGTTSTDYSLEEARRIMEKYK